MRRLLTLFLLCLPTLAAAEPYPALAEAPRLTLPLTLYAEDLARWTPERVDEAMQLADTYLDRCAIDLDWAPVQPLRPGDVTRADRLWRTDRAEEIVLLLRAPGDRRTYRMADVASLWRDRGRWMGEGAYNNLVLAVAQTVGRGRLKNWPRPAGPGAGEAVAKARLALMWAAAKGWITLEPAVSEGHCQFLRKRFMKLSQKPARKARPQVARTSNLIGGALRLPGTPSALLVADVANRDAVHAAIRVGDAWHMVEWLRHRILRQHPHPLPARGEGKAIVRVGGASLLLSEGAKGVHAAWWHPDPKRQAAFRPSRWLKGCGRVLAADILRPPGDTGRDDPGSAVVICPERVLQLTPLTDQAERSDPLPASTWATLTRWGPGRARLITGTGGGARSWDLLYRAPVRPWKDRQVEALGAQRPAAPIWLAPGADPVQIDATAVYGLAGGRRPLGTADAVYFGPNLYRVARLGPAKDGRRALRVDALYEQLPRTATVSADALVASHLGDAGPMLWVLDREGERWRLKAPAAGRVATKRLAQRRLREARTVKRDPGPKRLPKLLKGPKTLRTPKMVTPRLR